MAWRVPGAGSLSDRVTIRRRDRISDGMGGYVDSWSDLLTDLPARIVQTRGGESVQSQRLSGLAPADILIRRSDAALAVTSADIAVNARSGQIYNIKWVGSLEDGRKSFLLLACTAGEVSNG
jgi:head-tail adaptor